MTTNQIIGHRGACGYAPENTLASFNKALALGCRFVEFDVICSADGEPFVIHDEKLKRTTNGKGFIADADAQYLQTLDAGKWFSRRFKGEKIPHLKDVLQWLNFADVHANIEIKPVIGTELETVTSVLSCLNRYWPFDKPSPLISSFNWKVLRLCRTISPELPLGWLMHEWHTDWYQHAQHLDCVSVHCNRKILTPERAQEIKSKKYQLYAYTVNRKRQANKLFAMGVDAIFTDYPDLLS